MSCGPAVMSKLIASDPTPGGDRRDRTRPGTVTVVLARHPVHPRSESAARQRSAHVTGPAVPVAHRQDQRRGYHHADQVHRQLGN
ncbi:hypothetical protein GCM10009634_20320 [Saccharothrix xinjiangensis]